MFCVCGVLPLKGLRAVLQLLQLLPACMRAAWHAHTRGALPVHVTLLLCVRTLNMGEPVMMAMPMPSSRRKMPRAAAFS